MPKKSRPRAKWRERPRADFSDCARLNEEQVTAILGTVPFECPANEMPDAHGQFITAVETVIASYLADQHNLNSPKPREIKAALRQVAKASDALFTALDDLDSHSENYLENSAIAEQGIAGLVPQYPMFCSTARAINTYAKAAERRAPAIRRGRQKDPALYFFIDGLAMIWEFYTGKEFTRSDKRGNPIYFVTTVLKAVEPSIGSGAITGAMKKVVKEQKQRVP